MGNVHICCCCIVKLNTFLEVARSHRTKRTLRRCVSRGATKAFMQRSHGGCFFLLLHCEPLLASLFYAVSNSNKTSCCHAIVYALCCVAKECVFRYRKKAHWALRQERCTSAKVNDDPVKNLAFHVFLWTTEVTSLRGNNLSNGWRTANILHELCGKLDFSQLLTCWHKFTNDINLPSESQTHSRWACTAQWHVVS